MDTTALLFEAERYLALEDADRAAECLKQANALEHGHAPLPFVGLGRVALLLGRLDDAERLIEHALRLDPTSPQALTFHGVIAEARSELTTARSRLERALTADPTYAPAHLNLGRVLGQLRRWPEALAALHEALSLSPALLPAAPMLAVAAVRADAPERAIGPLTRLLEQHPSHVDALVTLADVLVSCDLAEHAQRLLANAVERLPGVPVLHARQSSLALRCGDLPLARAAVERQLALAPNDHEALRYAASLALMARDLDQAERLALQVLATQPADWRAHHLLGTVYDALRLRGPAMVAFRAAIRHEPQAWQPRSNLAALLLEERSAPAAAEAKRHLEEALAVGPSEETLEARYNLALAHWQLGERAEAERTAKAVATSPSERPFVAVARSFLECIIPPDAIP